MTRNNLYDYLVKVQAITKIGLLYSTDPYAVANYLEIQKLTLAMLESLQDVNLARNNYFKRDIYPTPNISVRTIIFNENNEFLMVRENDDGGYSFPGGWADLYDGPSVAAKRETIEEAGAEVEITNLVALLHRTPFKSATSVPEYVICFKAKFICFLKEHDHEITDVNWFTRENLPPFSPKVTKAEMLRMLDAALSDEQIFD